LLLQGTNDKETHLLFCDLQHTKLGDFRSSRGKKLGDRTPTIVKS